MLKNIGTGSRIFGIIVSLIGGYIATENLYIWIIGDGLEGESVPLALLNIFLLSIVYLIIGRIIMLIAKPFAMLFDKIWENNESTLNWAYPGTKDHNPHFYLTLFWPIAFPIIMAIAILGIVFGAVFKLIFSF